MCGTPNFNVTNMPSGTTPFPFKALFPQSKYNYCDSEEPKGPGAVTLLLPAREDGEVKP